MNPSERAFTQRATRLPIEYNYTNADIHAINASQHDGYEFEYPVNWRGDLSTNKVIGLRRISYKPCSVSLTYDIRFNYTNAKNEEKTAYLYNMTNVFTSQNTFEEAITKVGDDIYTFSGTKATGDAANNIVMMVDYDKVKGNVKITFQTERTKEDPTVSYKVRFTFPRDNITDEQIVEWLKLFNQPVNANTIAKFKMNYCNQSVYEMTFDNVWNRDDFYCHSSFSDSPRHVIGLNNDFWQSPSVLYAAVDNSNDFNVYFTTDTINRILPRNGVLLIQLSYIFNYLTTTALM